MEKNTGRTEYPLNTSLHPNPDTDEEEIDLLRLLYHLLERGKWILIVSILGAVLTGVITHFLITPKYTATSKLYVLSTNDAAISLSDFQIGTYLTADYQEVFKNWHVHERVIDQLNLPYDYEQITGMLEVENPSGTRILYLTITAEDPLEAKQIADTYASVAQEFIASTMDTKMPNLFEEALLPTHPSSPLLFKNILIAFLLCMFLSVMVFGAEFLTDNRIHTSDDLEHALGISTLGYLTVQEKQMVSILKKQNADEEVPV